MTAPAKAQSPILRLARFVDRYPVLALPLWIAAYFVVLWSPAHRPLSHDELFTYYVSMSPTVRHFIGCIRFVDLNPPLSYAFVRSSIVLFGDSPFSTRLPSLLSFLVASLTAWRLIARRLGGALGLAALGIFWSFALTAYAVDARPYALLLASFSLATLCWLRVSEADFNGWTRWHTGLTLSILAMLLTHCFSLVFVAAMVAGEFVRAIRNGRIDKRVWGALLAPLSLVPLYIPLVSNAQSMCYPFQFHASALTLLLFYLWVLLPVLPAIAAVLVWWLAFHGKDPPTTWRELARPHEIVFCLAAWFAPATIIAYCAFSTVPYQFRYGIGAMLGGSLMLAVLLASVTRKNINLAAGAAVLILALFLVTKADTGKLEEDSRNATTAYRTIRPELPFVTASGLAFLEMDRREPAAFIHRLYYLTDRESALRYAHATIYESMAALKCWFPIRANVSPYYEFLGRNRQFLLLATPGYPEDWLLLKLQADGAQIRLLQDAKTGYRDHELYEVTVRD